MLRDSFVGCRFVVVACLFLLLFSSLAPSLGAQTAATGALTGTVTDSTGAVVPNTTVTATSVDTGQGANRRNCS